MAEVHPGVVIAGKYVVERVLGQGGIGRVVQARHLQLEDRVAIKMLLPEAASSVELRQRFLAEAKAARQIKSEHVARVTDVGEMPEDGTPFLVMEFLDGHDLSCMLAQRGPLPIPEAIEYMLQTCEALAEAHALGIVHRDVKPANLFLTTRFDGSPCVKLLDFGIAKMPVSGTTAAALTRTHAMLGTVLYAAPEQLQSAKNVDHRSDIWSLGATLFQLVTGHPPFCGDDLGQLLTNVITMPPREVRTFVPDAPALVEQAIGLCLQKDPAARHVNVAAFAAIIAPHARTPDAARRSVVRMARSLRIDVPLEPATVMADEPAVQTLASDGRSAEGVAEVAQTHTVQGGVASPVILSSGRSSRPWSMVVLALVALASATAFFVARREAGEMVPASSDITSIVRNPRAEPSASASHAPAGQPSVVQDTGMNVDVAARVSSLGSSAPLHVLDHGPLPSSSIGPAIGPTHVPIAKLTATVASPSRASQSASRPLPAVSVTKEMNGVPDFTNRQE